MRRLRENFTAKNFSDVPLALMEDGLAGSIGTKELTANARLLESSFKPIDAAIRVKRINAQMAGKGRDVPRDSTDEFLGISQTRQVEAQE